MYNRYLLLKKWYPEYVVFISKNLKLKTFDDDLIIYKYNKKLEFNHVILINNQIEIIDSFDISYEFLKNKSKLINFFTKHQDIIRKNSLNKNNVMIRDFNNEKENNFNDIIKYSKYNPSDDFLLKK